MNSATTLMTSHTAAGLIPDPKAILTELRDQRVTLVQTVGQYQFALETAIHLADPTAAVGAGGGEVAFDV
jgi:protein tyrosine phosphatase